MDLYGEQILEKICHSSEGNRSHEAHAVDDATCPRDRYPDTWYKGIAYARGRAIEDWLGSMGVFVVGATDKTTHSANRRYAPGTKAVCHR